MKALSTTILIVVSAVVILVAALVVLTIFGGGMGQLSSVTNFKNNCLTQAQVTCKTMGALPPTWKSTVTITENGQQKQTSCWKETGNSETCQAAVGITTTGGSTNTNCLPQGSVCGSSISQSCCSSLYCSVSSGSSTGTCVVAIP